MSRIRRQSKRLTAVACMTTFGILLLAGALGGAWAMPGRASLGQTIPLPPTATPTNTAPAQPTATWTPLPTWTHVATEPPAPPTATATPGVSVPTATPPAIPTMTEAQPEATATFAPAPSVTPPPASATPAAPVPLSSATPTHPAILPTQELPAPTPSSRPIPLVFDVASLSQVAGPQDEVQFILQVSNVGYGPVDGVQVEVAFANELQLRFVECARCSTDCPQCKGGPQPARLTIFIGRLLAGEQVIAPVHTQVADDAWPGQTLVEDWTLSAVGLPPQTAQTSVVLPWVPLPATGVK